MKPKYIKYDWAFEKKFNKYKNKLTENDRQKLKERLKIFAEDIFDKRLKTHKLKGELKSYYAFWINYSDRIVFRILEDERVIFPRKSGHNGEFGVA